jgi:hypothetical protein
MLSYNISTITLYTFTAAFNNLASSAGLSKGSSLRIGFEKIIFPPPDSSGEMPAEEAINNCKNVNT